MTISRRDFLIASTAVAALHDVGPLSTSTLGQPKPPLRHTFDPWLEISAAALEHNVRTASRLAGGRPVLAVAKNNAYGCGLSVVGPMLDKLDTVWGIAVVRSDEARALRRAGVRKPVLLMGPVGDEEAEELVRANVRLAPYDQREAARLIRLARRVGRAVLVHLYVDTGMHRMGMPHDRVAAWLDDAALRRAIGIEGMFTELTEDPDFDREQAARLRTLAGTARAKNLSLGRLHAASSDTIAASNAETFLDAVRPGLVLYGGYPTTAMMERGELKPVFRLKARVIRVDQLTAGEGISYHRRFIAQQPTTIATLAIGHVDGYPTGAVKGCEVSIRGILCPVVGTVSASHTVVALRDDLHVEIGDEAILVGPDHASLHPNIVAQRSGWSEYNMFMHLNPGLERRLV
jgi:alanine racemase